MLIIMAAYTSESSTIFPQSSSLSVGIQVISASEICRTRCQHRGDIPLLL